jgi:tripartite-type tricarboxylate transporter receptor subunit TctC
VASDKRSPDMPDVPTVAESGGPANYEVAAWVGFLAPRGTPPATLDKINRDVARALREPEMQGFFVKVGYEPAFSTRDEMAARIRTETRRNGERVIRAGAKAE